MMEIFKMLLSLIGGGLGGALLNEWLHRRRARMQPIPLIERVNRLVSSELKGFVLARRVGTDRENQSLEVVRRIREYQFTLRNSSYIHLHNAEVQFEFPSKDIDGRAERPSRSKTTPVQVESEIAEPWKAGYRWRIPELPPGDSIEFTFRAVDPSSDEYEVALYNGGQIVIEKSKGEPREKQINSNLTTIVPIVLMVACLTIFAFMIYKTIVDRARHESTIIDWAGCNLMVSTTYDLVNAKFFSLSQSGPWSFNSDIMNTGNRKCFLKWQSSSGNGFTVDPGSDVTVDQGYTNNRPRLAQVGLLFGLDSPINKATVGLYLRGKP